MKLHYRFSNLLGTVYRRGNLLFTPDGDSVVAAVGNKVSLYNLRWNRSETLPVEARTDFVRLALSGALLLAASDDGDVHLVSLVSKTVLHTLRTHRPVLDLRFTPDGRRFCVAKEGAVLVYRTPGAANREYSPFVMERVLKGAYQDVSCVAWTSCSRIAAVGSKDGSVRLYALQSFRKFGSYSLGGHADEIVAVFFERDSLNCYTVSANGRLSVWECSLEMDELKPGKPEKKRQKRKKKASDKDDSEDDLPSDNEGKELSVDEASSDKLFYKCAAKHFLRDHLPQESKRAEVTAADYSSKSRVLVAGFSSGAFFIFEMPDCALLHSLSISEQRIAAASVSPAGDWIAFGCPDLGQLLVWEWQSETYVMKQQGHFNSMACMAYAPGGQHVATGGEDGKVKLWSAASGFSFVTFGEHDAGVTGVAFAPSGKAVLSCSLDGSVRAFDMARYRNFRTFTAARPVQFGCLAVDSSGDLVAAGGIDVFEIFLWSMQTGRLLEVISSHEGPVASLAFSPSPTSSMLASASWDKTLRLWNALAVGSSNESIAISSDATAVAFSPDGSEVAVATLNGHITFFDTKTSTQTGVIEGRKDLGSGRADADLVTAEKAREGKGFLTLCYSSDGSCVLAGGQSKHICIYHVREKLLLKKFEVTQNRSFDAMDEVISRRKMSEFGNLALVEDRDEEGRQAIKLPGTKKGDKSSRALRPEVRVTSLRFSPTGRDFAAATSEGLLVYSLDRRAVFDPFELAEEVTPAAVRRSVADGEHQRALLLALRLGERDLVRLSIEHVDHAEIELACAGLPGKYVLKLTQFVAEELETSPHLHFYAKWARQLLLKHGADLRRAPGGEAAPALSFLQKSLMGRQRDITKMTEYNSHTMAFLLNIARLKKVTLEDSNKAESGGEENGDDESVEMSEASEDEGAFASNWTE